MKEVCAAENVGYSKVKNSEDVYLVNILGFSDKTYELAPVNLINGNLPKTSDEIVLPSSVANGRYTVGDKFTAVVGDRYFDGKKLYQCDSLEVRYDDEGNLVKWNESLKNTKKKTYTVVGIIDRAGFESFSAAGYNAITAASGKASDYRAFIKLKDAKGVYDFLNNKCKDFITQPHDGLLTYMGVSDDNTFIRQFYAIGAVLIIIVVLGSISLIYNAFSISVSERTKQFGLLSSVGATRRQIKRMVLFEGVTVCAFGIPIGVLSGVAGAGIVLKVLAPSFSQIIDSLADAKVSVHVSFSAIVITAVISFVTVLISALLPAVRASRVTPIEAIRQTNDIKVKRNVKTPKLTAKIFGVEGIVAWKNFKNNKRKYRSTVISLTFSVVLFVSASCFAGYLGVMSDTAINNHEYDIMWQPEEHGKNANRKNEKIYKQLKNASGVTDSGYTNCLDLTASVPIERVNQPDDESVPDKGKTTTSVRLHFLDEQSFRNFAKQEGIDPEKYLSADSAKAICYDQMIYREEDGKFVTEHTFNNRKKPLDVKIGSENVTVDYFSKSEPKFSMYLSGFDIIMPVSRLDKFASDLFYESEVYMLFNSSDCSKTSEEMNKILADNGYYSNVDCVADREQTNRALIKILGVFSFGFIALIALISVANVFNTISTNIHLRRREFAMLRSVGMTDGGFNKIMIIECIFYGVKSVIYGVILSTLSSFLIYKASDVGFELSYSWPYKSILTAISSVFLVVVITMIYAMRKVKKQNTIEAIKDDNI